MAEAIDRDRAGSRKTDRVAAGAPIRKLLFIEALGHARVRFARLRPDHRPRVELATIDAHRAARRRRHCSRPSGGTVTVSASASAFLRATRPWARSALPRAWMPRLCGEAKRRTDTRCRNGSGFGGPYQRTSAESSSAVCCESSRYEGLDRGGEVRLSRR